MGNVVNIFFLIWKNFKLQIRHPWITALELIIPIFFMIILILLRFLTGVQKQEIETSFDSYDINSLPVEKYNISGDINLYYAPQTSFIDEVMTLVSLHLNVSVTGFDTEDDLVAAYKNSTLLVVAGVVFDDTVKNGVQQYGSFKFTIRPESIPGGSWNMSCYLPNFPSFEIVDKSIHGTSYMDYGFLPVQHAVSKSLLEYVVNTFKGRFDDMLVIEMCRQPYPQYESDSFYKLPHFYIIFSFGICFLFPSAMIAKNIVHERETKLKPTLIVMGISNWENWTAWFIKDFIFLLICNFIMTVLLCIIVDGHAVMNHSDASLIMLWLTLFSCDVIIFTFFITTFFKKENSAVAATCIVYILTFVPYLHGKGLFHQLSYSAQIVLCILPNTLFAYSVRVLHRLEFLGHGLHWKTINDTSNINLEIGMNVVFIMFCVDFLIYFILTWYTEAMCPGFLQEHRPWYFPFMATYWTGRKEIPAYSPIATYHFMKRDCFEMDIPKVKPMINIRNLTKIFEPHSDPVIDNVSIKAYKGQVTALQGSYGAGKTTLASLIYGGLTPTAGSIIIKGYDMCKTDEAPKIVPFLGICPDYDIAIDELSIQENFLFFCRIKGFESKGMKAEINYVLALLDLEIKQKRLVSTLLPSAKRRLSVGISLIGQSEVVIMDEPTIRMNSDSRRIVWDALVLEKKSRAIFLTTSHIKEADILADRIFVLDQGYVMCSGSPMFLKKKYGAGYLLTLYKEPEFKSVAIKSLISSKIPNVAVFDETESELKVVLPLDFSDSYEFLFKELEERDWNIRNMNVSEITLDQLNEKIICSPNIVKSSQSRLRSIRSLKYMKKDLTDYSFTKKRNEGFALFSQHAMAVFKKKYIFSKRNPILTLSQIIVLPLILTFSNILKDPKSYESCKFDDKPTFDLTPFGKTVVVYGIDPSSNHTIDLGDAFGSLLTNTATIYLVDLEKENFLTYLIMKAQSDFKLYKTKYIIGATFENDFNKTLITAYYNDDAYHSAPTSLLYVYNAILSFYTKESIQFSVRNKPLPFRERDEELVSTYPDVSVSYFWAKDLTIGLAILMSSFVVLIVTENSSGYKEQQIISGLNCFVYWFSSFIYDFAMYLIPCIFVLIIFSIFETPCLHSTIEIGTLALLLFLHGLSALLFIYCCSYCSQSAASAYISIFLYYILGLIFLTIVHRLEMALQYQASQILSILFSIFMPSYCISRGIYNLHKNCVNSFICSSKAVQDMCNRNVTAFVTASCCLDRCGDQCIFWDTNRLSLSMPGIGKQLIALVIQLFVLILILTFLEMEVFQNWKQYAIEKRRKYYDESINSINKDVLKEADKMASPLDQLIDEGYYLILKNASKLLSRFPVGKFSFGIKKGECFGLIGTDNTKSTILKMISGSIPLSTGNIYINGFNIMKYPHKILDKIGVSFQTYTLLKVLTVEETLILYAQIRGIPENEILYFIGWLTDSLDLYPHVLVKNCNISTRKKLCVAIAVIGFPPLVLLEEITAEMDPETCMNIRKCIKQALDAGCTIFFTTHKIDECQALCNNIGILVTGKLRYIGDFDGLKEEYKDGFTLIVRVKKTRKGRQRLTRQATLSFKGNLDEIKGHIEDLIPSAILKAEFTTYLNYYIPEKLSKWSKIFGLLEKLKFHERISSYSICETNLEHMYSYKVAVVDRDKDKNLADFLKERRAAKF